METKFTQATFLLFVCGLLTITGLSGCMHSTIYQTRAALPASNRVSVATGYYGEIDGDAEQQMLPVVEGLVQHRVSPSTALTLRSGPSGVQPGLQYLVTSNGLEFALQPEVHFALWNERDDDSGASVRLIRLGAGLRALVSRGEWYGGVGYHWTFSKLAQDASEEDPDDDDESRTGVISFALGKEYVFKDFTLRSEMAMSLIMDITHESFDDDPGYLFVPSLSFSR
jgi:hypothetical protein